MRVPFKVIDEFGGLFGYKLHFKCVSLLLLDTSFIQNSKLQEKYFTF